MPNAERNLARKRLRVVVVVPDRNVPSETFIRADIDRLPFDVIPIYGNGWGSTGVDGRRIWPFGRYFGALARRSLPSFDRGASNYLLARHLTKIRADAVLAEFGPTGTLVMEGCRMANVPLFVHFRGYDASVRTILENYRDSYARLLARAAGIVVTSAAMRRRLMEMGAPDERLLLNPSGVDPEAFYGAEPDRSAPSFVAVGRFVEKKAPYLTVIAFRQVLDACPEARLMMVGAGPLLGPTKRIAAALGVSDRVEFLGLQSPERISILMRESRAFVQHSLEAEDGDSEGTPVAVIEAQMSGLPVVSTLHAGIPDVVVDGKTGYLVAEGDAVGMGQRMRLLASDAELAGRLGRAGRQQALDRFTMDRHIRELAELIERGVHRHTQIPRPTLG
jgi:colanic acid/amylovoran biosynthesis glycosyltransferase